MHMDRSTRCSGTVSLGVQMSLLLYSRGLQISDQPFDLVLSVHEVPDQSQTLLRVTQSFVGSLFHSVCLGLMSERWTEGTTVKTQTSSVCRGHHEISIMDLLICQAGGCLYQGGQEVWTQERSISKRKVLMRGKRGDTIII